MVVVVACQLVPLAAGNDSKLAELQFQKCIVTCELLRLDDVVLAEPPRSKRSLLPSPQRKSGCQRPLDKGLRSSHLRSSHQQGKQQLAVMDDHNMKNANCGLAAVVVVVVVDAFNCSHHGTSGACSGLLEVSI